MIWPLLWAGCFYAAPFPFALWLGLGDAPLVSRLPWSLGLATLYGLAMTLRQAMSTRVDLSVVFVLVASVCVQALILTSVRKRRGWLLTTPGAPSTSSNQFGINHLLGLTAGAAGLLGFANALVEDWGETSTYLYPAPIFVLGIAIAVQSLVGMAIGAPAAGMILAERDRRGFAIWLVVGLTLLLMIAFPLLLLSLGGPGSNRWTTLAFPPLILTGFLFWTCGTFLVVRRCGYRLVRTEKRAAFARKLPPEADAGH